MTADALEQVANEIRRRLYSSEYGCLTAFLAHLAHACGAVEAGLISILDGDLILRRSSSDESRFGEIKERIKSSVQRGTDEKHTINNLARYRWIEELSCNVVLRRIWPADAWRNSRRETFWLFILAPRLIFPQIKESPSDDEVQQLGGLASAFVRWKNELFSQHSEALSSLRDDSTKVLQEFRKFVVRPVRADHFFCILNDFDPVDREPFRWVETIDRLAEACMKPADCRCFKSGAMAVPYECPQSRSMDHQISVLAKLEKWRTHFWKPEHRNRSGDRGVVLAAAIEGLREAIGVLCWREREVSGGVPLNFSEGAVGYAGERALVRYFCAFALKASIKKLGSKWQSVNCEASVLEFAASLASLASLLIGDGRWEPSAIQNLVHVVAGFGHIVLGIPDRVDLVRHLQQTLRGESALHTLKSRYRDHFFHTLEVCFLGLLILTSYPEWGSERTFAAKIIAESKASRKKLIDAESLDAAQEMPSRLWPPLPENEHDFLAQWWCASLIHDTAYGIDIFDGTLKLLDFFTNRDEVKAFVGAARKTVENMADDLRKVAQELRSDVSIKRGDHGVIAAASLKNVLNSIGAATSRKYEPAVRAIAFHNTRVPKVDAGLDPVAALLILCDTVQEWGRSSLGFDRSPAVLLSRMIEASSVPSEEQFGPVKRYGLSVEANLDGVSPGECIERFGWREKDKMLIELDYGEESLRECRAKFTWTDMTYNLQRVDFRPWGVDIRVQVSVPFSSQGTGKSGGQFKTQFEYFGEFISQQQVRFMESWYRIAYEEDPEAAVCHSIQRREAVQGAWVRGNPGDPGVRELITFRLNELSRLYCEEQAVMGGHVGNFSEAIIRWTDYHKELEASPAANRSPI